MCVCVPGKMSKNFLAGSSNDNVAAGNANDFFFVFPLSALARMIKRLLWDFTFLARNGWEGLFLKHAV